MAFFRVDVMASWATTILNESGLYFLADTTKFSIFSGHPSSDAKDNDFPLAGTKKLPTNPSPEQFLLSPTFKIYIHGKIFIPPENIHSHPLNILPLPAFS